MSHLPLTVPLLSPRGGALLPVRDSLGGEVPMILLGCGVAVVVGREPRGGRVPMKVLGCSVAVVPVIDPFGGRMPGVPVGWGELILSTGCFLQQQ